MNIMLNGENFFFDKSLTIDELLKKNNISLQNIVIEINKEIITKSLWGKYKLNSGDEVEIITDINDIAVDEDAPVFIIDLSDHYDDIEQGANLNYFQLLLLQLKELMLVKIITRRIY